MAVKGAKVEKNSNLSASIKCEQGDSLAMNLSDLQNWSTANKMHKYFDTIRF